MMTKDKNIDAYMTQEEASKLTKKQRNLCHAQNYACPPNRTVVAKT